MANYHFDYQGYKTERQKKSEELGLSTPLTEKEYNAVKSAPETGAQYSSSISRLLENKQELYESGMDEESINLLQENALRSADPEEAEADMLSAIAFARNLDIPVSEAYRNLDALMDAQFFNNVPRGKTAPRAIKDSFALGDLTVQRGHLGTKMMNTDPDSDEYKELMAQYADLTKQIESKQDYLPRSWVTYILKAGANTAAYSLENMATRSGWTMATTLGLTGLAEASGLSIAGSALAGTAIAGIGVAALPIGAVIAAAGIAVGIAKAWQNGTEIEGGNQYLNLLEEGIDHKTASRIGLIHGMISSGIEQTLEGVIGGLSTSALRMTGIDANALASKVITKSLLDGTLGRRLATIGAMWAKDVLEEGLEEAFQGLSEDITKNIAYVLSDMNAPVSFTDAAKDMFEEALGGMAGAVLLGLGGAVGDVHVTAKQAYKLRTMADNTSSKIAFTDRAKQILPEGLTEEDQNTVINTIWDAGKANRDKHWTKVSDVLENTAFITELPTFDAGGSRFEASWDDENEIFQLDDASFAKSDNKQSHTIRFGNLDQRGYNSQIADVHKKNEEGEQLFGDEHEVSANRQMQIAQGAEIEFTTEGNSLTIENVKLAEGLDESIREKAVKRLISIFPDYDIKWNDRTKEDTAAKESVIALNPRGSRYGLNYRESTDSASTQFVKRWLGNRFSEDDTENSIMAMSVEAMAKKYGLNGKEFIEKYSEDIQSIKGNKKAEALIAANGGKIEDIKGFTSAIKDARDNIKAVIYAGEKADLSTFQHEMHHLIMAIGENKKEFKEALDKARSTDVGRSIFKRFVARNLDIISHAKGADGRLDEKKLQAIMDEIEGGDWKVNANEFEVELFNAWQREGKSINKELMPIMQRIAESIRKVFSILKRDGSGVKLNDEISEYYEKLYGADSDGKDRSNWSFNPDSTITPVNTDSNVLESLKAKYGQSFSDSKDMQKATAEEEKAIKRIIYEYPRHSIADGIEMLDGLNNDKHDLPMQKEYLTAMLMNGLFGEKMILLPRYMDRMLNEIAGKKRFSNYSLADGISAIAEDGRTFEFKYVSAWDKVIRRLNDASAKADVSVVIVSFPNSIKDIKVNKFEGKKDAYIVNIHDENNIEVYEKNTSTTWRLWHPDQKSRLNLDISRSIHSIIRDLQKVNSEDQITMDYSVYLNSNGNNKSATGLTAIKNTSDKGLERSTEGELSHIQGFNNKHQTGISSATQISIRSDAYQNISDTYINSSDSQIVKSAENPENILLQRAFHGSGAEFENFDDSYIGTGTGMQSFGYGHYLSDEREVAADYANQAKVTQQDIDSLIAKEESSLEVSKASVISLEKEIAELSNPNSTLYKETYQNILESTKRNIEKAKQESNKDSLRARRYLSINDPEAYSKSQLENRLNAKKNELVDAKKSIEEREQALDRYRELKPTNGYLYETEIPDDGYIDWIKKLSRKDADAIYEEFGRRYPEKRISYPNNGISLEQELSRELGSHAAASEFLSSMGFNGFKYSNSLIGKARTKVERRATNYVVFKGNDISKESSSVLFQKAEDNETFGKTTSSKSKANSILSRKKELLEAYSDPSLYTQIENSNGNVFVYRELYDSYANSKMNKQQMEVYEKELKSAKVFGDAGFKIFVLPESIVLVDGKYNGSIPDAFIDGYLVEFKKMNSSESSQFQKEISRASSKADISYIDLQDEYLIDGPRKKSIINAIRGKVSNSSKYDKKIIVVTVKGENPTAYEINNGHPIRVNPLARLKLSPQPYSNSSEYSEALTEREHLNAPLNYINTSDSDSVNNGVEPSGDKRLIQLLQEQRLRANPANFDSEGNHLAPNGQKSNLSYRQWVQVRTPEFKNWFGDWETVSDDINPRLKNLIRDMNDSSLRSEISVDMAKDKKDLEKIITRESKSRRGEIFCPVLGRSIQYNRNTIKEVLHHDYRNEAHLASVYYIPEFIQNGKLLANVHDASNNREFSYLVSKFTYGNSDYLVRSVIKRDGNSYYYDHKLSDYKKFEELIDELLVTSKDHPSSLLRNLVAREPAPLYTYEDNRLLSVLQGFSKVIDENGEPLVMYHGSSEDFDIFETGRSGENWGGYASHGIGSYFTSDYDDAVRYAKKASGSTISSRVYPVFLNIRNPFTGSFSKQGFRLGDKAWENLTSAKESLSDYGYDGYFDDAYKEGRSLAVITDPNQVKSATDNNGDFSVSDPSILNQIVYHASPNEIKGALSTDYMGTGEGAQYHGWGLYFALNKNVSDIFYRRILLGDDTERNIFTVDGKDVSDTVRARVGRKPSYEKSIEEVRAILIRKQEELHEPERKYNPEREAKILQFLDYYIALTGKEEDLTARQFFEKYGKEYDARVEELKLEDLSRSKLLTLYSTTSQLHDSFYYRADLSYRPDVELYYTDWNKLEVRRNNGSLLEVDIPESYELLDEQLRLKNQSPYVIQCLENLWQNEFGKKLDEEFAGNEEGIEIYYAIVSKLGKSKKKASLLLDSYGVKGITYIGIRDGRCFVIFNGDSIKSQHSILFQTNVSDSFKNELENLSEQDIGTPDETIVFAEETPLVFRELGMPDLPVEMYKDKLSRALYLSENERHGHANALSKEIIQQVAENFADPLMVFLSKNGKDLVAVYEVLDNNGNAVMAIIRANVTTSEWNIVNLITSTYGRESRQYEKWINEQRLKYVDDTKKGALTVRLQLPSTLTPNENVLRKSDIVNKYGNRILFQKATDDMDEIYEAARDALDYNDFAGFVKAMYGDEYSDEKLLSVYADVKDAFNDSNEPMMETDEYSDTNVWDVDYAEEEDTPEDLAGSEEIDPFDDIKDTRVEITPDDPLENVSDEEIEQLQRSMIAAFQEEKGEPVEPTTSYSLRKPDETLNNIKDKNRSFDRIISTDSGIIEFISGIRQGLAYTRDGVNIEDYFDKTDEGDAWKINNLLEFKNDFDDKAAPLVKSLAYSISDGYRKAKYAKANEVVSDEDIDLNVAISSKAAKSLRGIIRNNIDFYRDLYGKAMTDGYWMGLPTLEEMYGLDERLTNIKGLSITEIKKMAEAVKDDKLRDRIIRGGKASIEEVREYLSRAKKREETAKEEYDLALQMKEDRLREFNGNIMQITFKADKAEKELAEASAKLEETAAMLEAKVNALAEKAKKAGLEAEEIQEQQKLAKKKAYYERLVKQRQNVLKNIYSSGSEYYGKAGEKKALELQEKIDHVAQSIAEMSERSIITEKEAIDKLIDLADMIGKDRTEKAVYKAVTLERWKNAKKDQEQRAKAAEDKANAKDLNDKKLRDLKAEYEAKIDKAVTWERWMAAKKAIEKAQKAAEDKANAKYENALKLYNQRKNLEAVYEKKIKELKAEYQNKAFVEKLRARMKQVAKMIMRPASPVMALEEAAELREIQAKYDPQFRSKMKVGREFMNVSELKAIYRQDPDDARLAGLSDYQKSKLGLISLDEMSLGELERLKRETDDLRALGRAKRQAYLEERKREVRNLQTELINQITSRRDYDPSDNIGGSRERRKMLKRNFRDVYFATLTMPTKAKQLDNHKEGLFYDLLVKEKREHQREEWSARYKREEPVNKLMEELGIDALYFYKNYKDVALAGLNGTRSYSYSDLAYIYLAANSERNVEAVSYGTLITKTERSRFYMEAEEKYPGNDIMAITSRSDYIDNEIRTLGDARFNELLRVAKDTIENDEKAYKVVKAIESDLNEKERFEEIKENIARRYNQVVEKVDYYLPINRNDSKGETPADKVANDLLNQHTKTGKPAIGRGFTITRLDISPRHQPSTNIDLLGVWQEAVKNQEHMLAFGDYVDKLNAVFENKGEKRDYLNEAIIDSKNLGKAMLDDIKEYIETVANPDLAGQGNGNPVDPAIRFAKGGIYSGYLGFKMSSIIAQALTSPAAFYGKVSVPRMLSSFVQLTMHPDQVREKINAISPFMRNRSFSMIYEDIKSAQSEGDKYSNDSLKSSFREKYNEVLDFGMKGLEWIDWYCVSAGWKAIYDEEIIKLGGESEENVRKAVEIADKYVAETQPLTDATEIAPYLNKGSEAMKILTQFRASLNVIWNNSVVNGYALNPFKKDKVSNAQIREAIGQTVGYIGAGILVALIQGELGGGDDDDPKSGFDILRGVLAAGTSQFTDSVPLLGDLTSTLVSTLITGEYAASYGTTIFPFAEKTLSGIERVSVYLSTPKDERDDEKLWKAVRSVGEGAALAVGLPVSGYKEAKALWDNRGNGGWMALLGRREFNEKK